MAESQIDHYDEQHRYAKILFFLSRTGLVLVSVGFAIYLFGGLPTFVESNESKNLLSLSAPEFVSTTGLPVGWAWVNYLSYGDIIANVGLVFLALTTILCYLAVLPVFISNKDFIYLFIGALQLGILLLSASGLFRIGGH